MQNKHRQHGWLLIEILVTISVITILAGALTAVMHAAGKSNRHLWAREQALYAVEAQLDCLTHTAAPLPEEEFKRLWPGFSYEIGTVPEAGSNAEVESVKVTVTGLVGKKNIRVMGQRTISKREQ